MTHPSDTGVKQAETHTRGPWQTGKGYGLYGVEIVGDDGNVGICGIAHIERPVRDKEGRVVGYEPIPESVANVRLICAAPDLLAACKAYVEAIEEHDGSLAAGMLAGCAFEMARTAIETLIGKLATAALHGDEKAELTHDAIVRLIAEKDRLREALGLIEEMPCSMQASCCDIRGPSKDDWRSTCEQMSVFARVALATPKPQRERKWYDEGTPLDESTVVNAKGQPK